MGFFDSMKSFGSGALDVLGGIGRGLGTLVEAAIPVLGPPLLNLGAQFVAQKIGVPGGAQGRPTLGPSAGIPPHLMRPAVRTTPSQVPFLPAPARFPTTAAGRFQTVSLPGGFNVPSFPSDRFDPTLGGFTTAGFDLPGVDIVNPFQAQGAGACPTLFRGTSGARPIPLITVPNPMTGAPVFYKHAGRPVLFSSDFAAARKVGRLARRARRRP
jgi:hypothetical protein